MPETEEERRLRKEKKRREAAQKAAEAEKGSVEAPPGAVAPTAAKVSAEAAASASEKAPKETEEERRLRKEKKRREAAQKAAEAEKGSVEAPTAAKAGPEAAAGASEKAPKETEEERRLRKEKRRALREVEKQQEAANTNPTAPAESSESAKVKPSKEERRAAKERERRGEVERGAAAAGAVADGHQHHHHRHRSTGADEATGVSGTTDLNDADAALLRAIAEENNAVVSQRLSHQQAGSPMAHEAEGGEAKASESAEERAERKRAEREERRRLRHAVAAATSVGAAEEGESNGGPGRPPSSSSRHAGGASPTTTAFDPTELQRQAYRAQFQRDLARATALRRLVDFDGSSGVVLDLAPQSAYDLYIREFGQSGHEQVGIQAPPEEERLDVETQAERGKLRSRMAQVPDDLGLCPEEEAARQCFQLGRGSLQRKGADAAVSAGGTGGRGGDTAEGEDDSAGANDGRKKDRAVDAGLLARFLAHTFPVMSTVLEEGRASTPGGAAASGTATQENSKPKGATTFSSSHVTFCWRGTRNRPVVQVLLDPSNRRQLIALHGPTSDETGPSPTLDTYASVLLFWNVHETSTPERVLVSCSPVTNICVSPTRPHLVYGGTADGNVCVWNLQEPDRQHLAAGRYETMVFHLPSYTSAWQFGGHTTPVRQVRVAGYNAAMPPPRKEEQHEQLVSMDEQGALCYWTLTERREAEAVGGAAGLKGDDASALDIAAAAAVNRGLHDGDYGLHPCSTVSLQLTKGATATAAAAVASSGAPSLPRDESDDITMTSYGAAVAGGFDFSPKDSAQCVVTATHGVVRRSRFGGIAAPSLYGPACGGRHVPYPAASLENPHGGQAIVVPCCLQYSVTDPRWFIVGYEDGTVRLYLEHEATPQLRVEVGYHPIVAVRCSGATPWVVWALDQGGEVHMIDLAYHRREAPRLSHTLNQPDTGLCLCFDLSPHEDKADQRFLVAGFENGMVQLYELDMEKLRVANSERDAKWI